MQLFQIKVLDQIWTHWQSGYHENMNDIIKIVKPLKESDLLIKGVSEAINNEAKKQKDGVSRYAISYIRC